MPVPAVLSGLFSQACYTTLIVDHSLDVSCIKIALATLVGYLIIAGSLILKLPQILKIVRSGSAQGLVASSFALSMFSCMVNFSWAFQQGMPADTYLENFAIVVQDACLVLLVCHYNGGVSPLVWAAFLAFLVFAYASLTGLVGLDVLLWLKGGGMLTFCLARLPQVWDKLWW